MDMLAQEHALDAQLMVLVNALGIVIFSSIVLYHFITVRPTDRL